MLEDGLSEQNSVKEAIQEKVLKQDRQEKNRAMDRQSDVNAAKNEKVRPEKWSRSVLDILAEEAKLENGQAEQDSVKEAIQEKVLKQDSLEEKRAMDRQRDVNAAKIAKARPGTRFTNLSSFTNINGNNHTEIV